MSCSQPYDITVGIFRGYVSPIISVVGFIGNLLLIWTFTSEKHHNRFSIYNICLAIVNCAILVINSFIDDFLGRGLSLVVNGDCVNHYIKLDLVSESGCKFVQFFPDTLYLISSWIMVAFSVDRVLTICHAMRYQSSTYDRSPIVVCVIITVIGSLLNIPNILSSGIFQLYKNNETINKCGFLIETSYLSSRLSLYTKVIVSFTIPTFTVLIINAVIIYKLYHLRKEHRNLNQANNGLEMSRVVNHLVISSFFLTLTIPLAITMIIRLYWTGATDSSRNGIINLTKLFSSLKDVSYAANFFIYLICLRHFKTQFFKNVTNIIVRLRMCSKKRITAYNESTHRTTDNAAIKTSST